MKVDLEIEEMTPEERLKLWEPQARLLALRARSGEEILRFLISKGIPEQLAGERAAGLWMEAQRGRRWWVQPRYWVGGILIAVGLGVIGFSFLLGAGVLAAMAAMGLCGLGAAVIWGGFLERR